ncbi:MAG: GTP-binding protein, partial [Bacteroidaceae bacterium]|nr:GTP-binding protein [Bacteroidaceae bacterium]
MMKETPVLLLTGYLGSGKTTLVNRILSNNRGIRFAVIVNDIGEVNIDADFIQKGGIVGQKEESLVALQNGCICCTLKMDLIEQLGDIMKMQRFDYIVIEASGICEPEPIARTICSIPSMGYEYVVKGIPRLDCIVTVVDAMRMQSEFGCGDNLKKKDLEEDDIENLLIQQIEFCDKILLNKASEVTSEELGRIESIIRALQPKAEIIRCDYADVDLEKIIHTGAFDYENVATSATWIQKVEEGAPELDEDDDDDDEEEHHHHHHHDGEHDHHHDDDDDDEE